MCEFLLVFICVCAIVVIAFADTKFCPSCFYEELVHGAIVHFCFGLDDWFLCGGFDGLEELASDALSLGFWGDG